VLKKVAPGDEGAAEREKGFVGVRAAFVAQREAAEGMQPGQNAFDNPADDAEAAAMRTAGLGGPWTLPRPPRLGNRCAISTVRS